MSALVERLRAQARTKAVLETRNRQYFSTTTKPVSCSPDEFCEWQAADRIEELEQQLAELRTAIANSLSDNREDRLAYSSERLQAEIDMAQKSARRGALEEAAKIAETGDWYGSFQTYGDERLAKGIAAHIRSLPDSTPSLLEEQNANGGKEGE